MMRATTAALVALFACAANSATLSKNGEKITAGTKDVTEDAARIASAEDIRELPVIPSEQIRQDDIEIPQGAVKLADKEAIQELSDVPLRKITEDNKEIAQDTVKIAIIEEIQELPVVSSDQNTEDIVEQTQNTVKLAGIEKNQESPIDLKLIQNAENDILPLLEENSIERKKNPSEDKVKSIQSIPEKYIEKEIQIPVKIIEEPVQILRISVDQPIHSEPISNEIKPQDSNELVKPSGFLGHSKIGLKADEPSAVPAKPAEQKPTQNTNPFAQGIQNLQTFFQQGVQNVNQAITNIINPPLLATVQAGGAAQTVDNPNFFVAGIQNLQNGVQQGLQNINQTIQSIFNRPPTPSVAQAQSNDPDSVPLNPIQQGFVNITNGFQNGLQTLQNNFQSGLNNISQSVQAFINPQSSPPAASVQSDSSNNQPQQNNIFVQAIQNLQQGFQQGVQNINQTFQNIVNPPQQILSDEGKPLDPGATIQQGFQTVGQGIQQGFQQIGQNIQNFVSSPLETIQGPIQQGFQTVQQGVQQGVQSISQNIQNIFRPQPIVAVNAAIDPVTATATAPPVKIDVPEVIVDEHDPVEKDEVVYQGPPELPTEETISNQENIVVESARQQESERGGHLRPTVYQSNGQNSE